MNRLLLSSLLVFILFWSIGFSVGEATPNDTPVAVVTNVKGSVSIQKDTTTSSAQIGTELYAGVVIEVEKGSVSLVFMNGDFLELKSGERLKLGDSAENSVFIEENTTRGVAKEEVTTLGEVVVDRSSEVQRLAQLADVYGIRAAAEVVSVSPRLTISSKRPVFYWFDSDSANAGKSRLYLLVLKNEKGDVVLRKRISGKVYRVNRYVFPARLPGFKTNSGVRYSWGVFPYSRRFKPEGAMPARFVYADSLGIAEARQHIERLRAFLKNKKIDQTTFHLLASFYYTDERIRLFSDAFPHLIYVFKNHRDLPYPAEQLAILCQKFGNTTSQLTKFFVDQAYRARAGL